jgi:hypothetical protein
MSATLKKTLATATLKELHGYGVAFAGGSTKSLPHCPDNRADRLRPEPDSMALVILEIEKRFPDAKGKRGMTLVENLKQNCRTFTLQLENAIKREKANQEKEKKAKETSK